MSRRATDERLQDSARNFQGGGTEFGSVVEGPEGDVTVQSAGEALTDFRPQHILRKRINKACHRWPASVGLAKHTARTRMRAPNHTYARTI